MKAASVFENPFPFADCLASSVFSDDVDNNDCNYNDDEDERS